MPVEVCQERMRRYPLARLFGRMKSCLVRALRMRAFQRPRPARAMTPSQEAASSL